jgi:hypothetical protein
MTTPARDVVMIRVEIRLQQLCLCMRRWDSTIFAGSELDLVSHPDHKVCGLIFELQFPIYSLKRCKAF